jgi:hypothetical protein
LHSARQVAVAFAKHLAVAFATHEPQQSHWGHITVSTRPLEEPPQLASFLPQPCLSALATEVELAPPIEMALELASALASAYPVLSIESTNPEGTDDLPHSALHVARALASQDAVAFD